MAKQILTIFIAGLFSFFASCKGQNNKPQQVIATGKFKVGQIWKYANRNGEDSSTLTILKIEIYGKGETIIHIRVDGVRIYSPQAATGYSNFIGHLPFSEQALSRSVTKPAGQSNHLPDFAEGYNQWKEAWDSGKGGYWTVDLKEAVEAIDKAMQPKK